MVLLGAMNGPRSVEMVRLRVRDCKMDAASPMLHVLGKGRNGGKWRWIPMAKPVYAALLPVVTGAHPDRPVIDSRNSPGRSINARAVQFELRRLYRSLGWPLYGTGPMRCDGPLEGCRTTPRWTCSRSGT
jgi:integrase